ncbi:CobD/CbiB family cobalamin biosynthesis protein [Cupriavidus taiwanensis]|uniref:Cobalamin biosynthesis protein CobD n=1 Tax=Cupriavidus taiwanensis TaxID=164546 RepID=A0A7Z7JBL1_9BURK|nr:CobD/CbiB family cobalamin biosynthesis protein [Cupriavidus taiwanensis]SOY88926.1 adenosylcobinamide-phosphate synthase [Cupriavidus taiwanensis]SOZ03016.1 adenosylcobinamide-phosphate synthase [Cupriavidus taiwanensis]SOZ06291.1 adenosylcobinamide-phosphate synthase [Cupriavidus taiwanensis]SPC18822.1 adenosylcobinamide-phosphate synthase [Cupriavidus taiwanensis]SPD41220.1 Cobalamin biosynthesis protein CobD [Cupriavidus taiwanensis]
MLMLAWPACVAAAWIGTLLDRWLGEPRRWHPLVGFGRIAAALERRLNPPPQRSAPWRQRLAGLAGWCVLVLAPAALAWWLVAAAASWHPLAALALHALALYAALGARSLHQHIAPIAGALAVADLPAARALTARIVSRDTADADTEALARAACESALENGNDAVFGALFWFLVGGAPAVIVFRLANTLDAMWGYRTPRLVYFGWAAARLDDALNLVPARLTALSYALLGATAQALRCWRTQAPAWSSPNAGPVMAAGAGAIGVRLGGPARYHGEIEQRPPLGAGSAPQAAHVMACLRLVERTLWLWLALAGASALAALTASAPA